MFLTSQLRLALPNGRGRKREYSDASVLVISLVKGFGDSFMKTCCRGCSNGQSWQGRVG